MHIKGLKKKHLNPIYFDMSGWAGVATIIW